MMGKKVAKYRRIRTDIRVHPKTTGLSLLARDLMQQAIEANPLGLLRASPTIMAQQCGPLTTAGKLPSKRLIEAALRELVERPRLGHWWPAHEVLWIEEAADEQVMNPSIWMGLASLLATMPFAVRARIGQRYPQLGAESLGGQEVGPSVEQQPRPPVEQAPATKLARVSDTPSDQQQSPPGTGGALHPSAQGQVQQPTRARARETGLAAEAWNFEWRSQAWQELRDEIGVTLACPTSGAAKIEGIQRALDDFGRSTVEAVIAHEARAAADFVRTNGAKGRDPVFFTRMFAGDGFAARVQAWRSETAPAVQPQHEEEPSETLERLRAEGAIT